MIQTALYGFLIADSGVSALVSGRVYPLVIPEQVYDEASKRPCLVYSEQSRNQSETFCGTIDLKQSSFAIDCYARTYAAAVTLASAVKDALVDYHGDMQGVFISKISLETQFDTIDLEPGLFRVALSFSIWHAE